MKMRNLVASLVMLILAVMSPVHADCGNPLLPQENLNSSDVVFSGEVIAIEPTTMASKGGEPGREPFLYGGDTVTFTVLEAWKGVDTPTVTLYAPDHSESYTFEQGQRYLVYAYYGVMEFETAPLTTNGCKGNKRLADAEDDLQALRSPGGPSDPGTGGSGEVPAPGGLGAGTQPPPGITITDLNTLGGIDSTATDINEQGQIVGRITTPTGAGHAFVWQDGVLTDLGTLGGDFITASDINERGQIIGEFIIDESRSFLWQNGVMTDLATLGGAGRASAINDQGQIVGASLTSAGETHAVVWQNGVMTDLGTLGGAESGAVDINEQGQIIGESSTARGESHAFVWQDGVMTDLGTLGGFSTPYDINEQGQIVGTSETIDGHQHAFVWQNGVMTDLGTLGGNRSEGRAINERGQIAGESSTSGGETHAFIWQNGIMTDLGTLGGGISLTSDINERGQVVGGSETTGGDHAFVWQDGVILDLGTLGGDTSTAFAINERGQIVGQSTTAQGEMHATLWTLTEGSIPLPGTGVSEYVPEWLLLVPVLVGSGVTIRVCGQRRSV